MQKGAWTEHKHTWEMKMQRGFPQRSLPAPWYPMHARVVSGRNRDREGCEGETCVQANHFRVPTVHPRSMMFGSLRLRDWWRRLDASAGLVSMESIVKHCLHNGLLFSGSRVKFPMGDVSCLLCCCQGPGSVLFPRLWRAGLARVVLKLVFLLVVVVLGGGWWQDLSITNELLIRFSALRNERHLVITTTPLHEHRLPRSPSMPAIQRLASRASVC